MAIAEDGTPIDADPDIGPVNNGVEHAGHICESNIVSKYGEYVLSLSHKYHPMGKFLKTYCKGKKPKLRLDIIDSRVSLRRRFERAWNILLTGIWEANFNLFF